jgi:predicted RNA-binding Zn-ribbon protein involved in translation (DUF1610 family)
MVINKLSPEEKRLKEQKKYTNSHGGPEVRIDKKGRYFCLRCGSFICDEGCSKLSCPDCGNKFNWRKYIIKTPVI